MKRHLARQARELNNATGRRSRRAGAAPKKNLSISGSVDSFHRQSTREPLPRPRIVHPRRIGERRQENVAHVAVASRRNGSLTARLSSVTDQPVGPVRSAKALRERAINAPVQPPEMVSGSGSEPRARFTTEQRDHRNSRDIHSNRIWWVQPASTDRLCRKRPSLETGPACASIPKNCQFEKRGW